MFKITFVTTGHLYSNPRLVKELSTAAQNNWTGDVIYVQTLASLVHHDLEIQKRFPGFNFVAIAWYKKIKLKRVVSKAFQYIFQPFNPVYFHAYGSALFQKARKTKTNCVVGHNLGALPVIHRISKKKNVPFIFDIEDYHPGETDNVIEKNKRTTLMQKILPFATHITFASPLIGKEIEYLLNGKMPKSSLINNTFELSEFHPPKSKSGNVKLVWYSQTISYGRGLELIIESLKKNRSKVHLTLIGNSDPIFIKEWVEPNQIFISVIAPVSQVELHQKLSDFDIGLALELSSMDQNRQLCLTNKIWSYYLGGLYILATDTPAQQAFMYNRREHGCICQQSIFSLKLSIQSIIENIDTIRESALSRFSNAKVESWDEEKIKWLNVIKSLTNS